MPWWIQSGNDEAGYLPFVDGLRAVSIIGVVAFHAGVPGFSGGFIGVDIFFVISGYLIIGQILRAIEASRFSFVDFYARRSLRILPPFFVVLAATSIGAAVFLVTPRELGEFGWSELFSSIMLGNHFFLRTGDYFAIEAHFKPLLHLWTLSVEEQFYLVTPLLLWGAVHVLARQARDREKAVLPVLASGMLVLSLLCCIAFSGGRNPAFFLMPLRCWEFIAGGMLVDATAGMRRLRRTAIEGVAAAGAILILVSILFLSSSEPYPSGFALLPVAGAAAVILAGAAEPRNVVARLLSQPPMIAIGLLSYSWYLWHWPLIVFANAAPLHGPQLPKGLVAALVALLLASASYLLIERRIRIRRREIFQRFGAKRVVQGAALGCMLFAVVGGLFGNAAQLAAHGYTGVDTKPFSAVPPGGCAAELANPKGSACVKSVTASQKGLLLGDSFADVLYPAVFARGKADNAHTIRFAKPGCIPLVGTTGPRCPELAAALARLGSAVSEKPQYAIVEAAWPGRVAADFSARFEGTLAVIRKLGVSRILIVAPIPNFSKPALDCVIRSDRWDVGREGCTRPRAEAEAYRAEVLSALMSVASQMEDVRLVDPFDLFCDQTTCRPFEGNALFYSDNAHLSELGAQRVVNAFDADFRWVFGAAR